MIYTKIIHPMTEYCEIKFGSVFRTNVGLLEVFGQITFFIDFFEDTLVSSQSESISTDTYLLYTENRYREENRS